MASALIRLPPLNRFNSISGPGLLGRAFLAQHEGRIGTERPRRLGPYPNAGAALDALATLLWAKRRRGDQDRQM